MRIANRVPLVTPLLYALVCCVTSCQASAPASNSGRRLLNALQYGGSGSVDLGARITAADAALGSSCGTIEVPPGHPGLTVDTSPRLGSCHSLWLRSPVKWGRTAGPTLSSNTVILGEGAAAVQTLPPGAWITAQNLSHVRIENLWVTNPSTRTNTNVVFHCKTCTDVIFTRNHLYAEGGIWTDSTATTYLTVTSENVSSRVTINDNFLDGAGNGVDLALLQYTQHVSEENNQTRNAQYGTQWWGGDANDDGAVTNTRWAQDIHISKSVDENVTAGEWGSMGQDVIVTGAVADGCSDVCLDTEGGFRVSFIEFTVHNGKNGGLATFYYSQDVSFGPGTVTDDGAAHSMPFFLHNASVDPTKSYKTRIHDVQFVCKDTAALCQAAFDPIGGLTIDNNTFRNIYITSTNPNNSGFQIKGNSFLYTFVPRSGFNAVNIAGVAGSYSQRAEVSHNRFISSGVTQASGSYAMNLVSNDPNYNDTVTIAGNRTVNFTTDAYLTAASANSSITPVFILHGNSFGAHSVSESITGAHGAFQGDHNLTKGR